MLVVLKEAGSQQVQHKHNAAYSLIGIALAFWWLLQGKYYSAALCTQKLTMSNWRPSGAKEGNNFNKLSSVYLLSSTASLIVMAKPSPPHLTTS